MKRLMKFYNALMPPFSVHGLAEGFRRLPQSLPVRPKIAHLAQQTSGGRIRFATNAQEIAIAITLTDTVIKTHMTPLNMAGAELYVGTKRAAVLRPQALGAGTLPFERLDGYGICKETQHTIPLNGEMQTYTLYLPIFAGVQEVRIGLPDDAVLQSAQPYAISRPVVFYGSSITHGACAGRPSLTYPARVCAALDADFINLGFAGNALGDMEIAEYIAALDMSAFVMDYDWNAPDPDHLRRTHKPFFDTVRQKNPDLPILILSRIGSDQNDPHDTAERFAVIRHTYESALAQGDTHVALLDGCTLFAPGEWDLCLMDFVHPNDYGFHRMAQGILPLLERMLS